MPMKNETATIVAAFLVAVAFAAPAGAETSAAAKRSVTAETILQMLDLPIAAERARQAGAVPGRIKEVMKLMRDEGPAGILAAMELETEYIKNGGGKTDQYGALIKRHTSLGMSGPDLMKAIAEDRKKQLKDAHSVQADPKGKAHIKEAEKARAATEPASPRQRPGQKRPPGGPG